MSEGEYELTDEAWSSIRIDAMRELAKQTAISLAKAMESFSTAFPDALLYVDLEYDVTRDPLFTVRLLRDDALDEGYRGWDIHVRIGETTSQILRTMMEMHDRRTPEEQPPSDT